MIVIKPKTIHSSNILDELGQETIVVSCSSQRGTYEVWLPTAVLEMARKEIQYVTEPDDSGALWSIRTHVLIEKAGNWFMLSRTQAREMCEGILAELDQLEKP